MAVLEDEAFGVCARAIAKWGAEKQLDMGIEELSELTKAIVKYRRHNWNAVWRIKTLEEVADVELMCQQLRMMLAHDEAEYVRIKLAKIANMEAIINDDDPMRGLKPRAEHPNHPWREKPDMRSWDNPGLKSRHEGTSISPKKWAKK